MVYVIEGIYKGIKENKAGSFTNDKGQIINYNDSYKIRFDQLISGTPKETELKIKKELALNISKNLNPYDKILLKLDVVIYGNNNISAIIESVEKK